MSDGAPLPPERVGPKGINLASKALGAAVIATNDEHFGYADNLIVDAEPQSLRSQRGLRGVPVDGWETRRHGPDHDWVIIRLAAPARISEVVVDTSFFVNNAPPAISLDGANLSGQPVPDPMMQTTDWECLRENSPCLGNSVNCYTVESDRTYTHLRLIIHPDGGVARLRVYGQVVLDPRFLSETTDNATDALLGCTIVGSSQGFGAPENLQRPGLPTDTHDGWETRRRGGTDGAWVTFRLYEPLDATAIEVYTTRFGGNAPEEYSVQYLAPRSGPEVAGEADGAWQELVPRSALRPDDRHIAILDRAVPVQDVRLWIYPDGGIGRFRVHGRWSPESQLAIIRRCLSGMPSAESARVLQTLGYTGEGIPDASEMATVTRDRLRGLFFRF
jgi:allantoicase